ncbi:MAG: hypothetical protein WCT04_01875 [Planctomycetota bacterium]
MPELEPKYIYAICIATVWITIRLALMYRRKVLIQRRNEREAAAAKDDIGTAD